MGALFLMSRGLYRDVLSYIGQELKFQNISPVPEKLTIALELSGLQQDMWDLFGCRKAKPGETGAAQALPRAS